MKMVTYQTLSEATNALKRRGFEEEFKMQGNQLKCIKTGKCYLASEMKIVEYHRFEGLANPSDMSIVFAIIGKDGIKGTVVSSYGTYANNELLTFMDKVKIADPLEAAGQA